ncbi:MAG: DUF6765 family protein, partial [Acidobacteriota bacterium]
SVDPAPANDPKAPRAWNRYAYAGANPLRFVDPRGKWEEDFHLYLTNYLALQAGFGPADAKLIAISDQAVDDEYSAADLTHPSNWGRHFSNDPTLDKQVRRSLAGDDLVRTGNLLHTVEDWYSHNAYLKKGHLGIEGVDDPSQNPQAALAAARRVFILLGGDRSKLDNAFLEKWVKEKDKRKRIEMLLPLIRVAQ